MIFRFRYIVQKYNYFAINSLDSLLTYENDQLRVVVQMMKTSESRGPEAVTENDANIYFEFETISNVN